MKKILKRLDVVEGKLLPKPAPDKVFALLVKAAAGLPPDYLAAFKKVVADWKGRIHGPLTELESEAVEACNAALERECQRAGFSSFAEFQMAHGSDDAEGIGSSRWDSNLQPFD